MAPEFNREKITASLGKPPYKIEDNSFKIHASCRHTHPSVDIALDLRARHHLRSEDISHIRVRTYKTALQIADNPEPRTIYAAKFSLPFCVAMALIKGSCGLEDFTEDNLWNPHIRDLMGRVRVGVDDALDKAHPAKWAAEVEIATRSGEVLTGRTDYPLGDPENPLDEEAFIAKFRRLTGPALKGPEVERFLHTALNIEKVEDLADAFCPGTQ